MYYIYILQSESSDHYYCGYSDEPWRRTVEHNTKPFNTYTSKYRPWVLVAVFECSENESRTIRIERFIKKQKSRKFIEKLIDPTFMPSGKRIWTLRRKKISPRPRNCRMPAARPCARFSTPKARRSICPRTRCVRFTRGACAKAQRRSATRSSR